MINNRHIMGYALIVLEIVALLVIAWLVFMK